MSITRRTLALGATGAAVSLAGCGGSHQGERAQGVLYGRAVSFTPPRSPWDEQWSYFRAKVDKDPSIKIDYFNRGETGGEEQQMFDLRRGRASMGGPSLQGLSTLIPEVTIAMAPYLFDSEGEVDFVYDNYLLDVFRPLFAAKNLYLMQWVEVGWTNLFSKRPVLTPRDAEGLKLRGSPNRAAQEFLRAIGADSVPLASVDIVPSMQTGLITGGLSATVFHYFSTRDYASDFTLTKHSYDTGAIVMNLPWRERATPRQIATLDAAWMSSVQARANVRRLTAFSLADMQKRGVRVHTLTPEQRAQWATATKDVVGKLIREVGGQSQAVYDAIIAGKKAYAALQAATAQAMPAPSPVQEPAP
jgi:TRAP-type C4-dicarboxylate transport system substrate-binding protein